MAKAIITDKLTKVFKDKTAVNAVDISVEENSLVALLGVNGAGKTTTIRMLSGLSKPTSGKATVMDLDVVSSAAQVKALTGISTQDTAVAQNLTVEENLRFMAQIYLDKTEVNSAVEEIISDFGLAQCRKKKAKLLSGGWQRRLSIAMAVIGKPRVLFLDEPTLGLDVLARRELWEEIERLKKNMTIVLTTHYMEEAQELADYIYIMIDGSIAASGTLDELEKQSGRKGLEDVFVSIARGEN
ncbi:MAG: ABC transporter ATP-binding protein [Lachnospiraceae bacterium]|nr:ABC transporter ATP-binding protein [Lachnospiraceae bacterium]